nr:uncharacterized protein LOC119170486 isoform X1 [Rhipicephalus microplus]
MAADRDEVETIVSSILASQKNGLPLQALDDEYRENVGTCIPYQELGYDTLVEFLESGPQVVSLQRAPDGEIVARAAYNALTAHVTKMVAEQKPGPVRARRQLVQRPFHRNVHPYQKANRTGGVASGPAAAGRAQAQTDFRAPRRKPLIALPGNVERFRNRRHWSRPRANQKALSLKLPMAVKWTYEDGHHNSTRDDRDVTGDSQQPQQKKDWRASNVMAWTSFLSAAGVIHQRAAVYAKLLMWHGATPSSMWLFTGQDIFQMGICDYRDIRMIQEHAHLLHAMHRSSAMAEDRLGMSGYPVAFDVASAQQDGFSRIGA